ncbi:MAG TPA: class I SAM-dependent methyltransferase [Thermoanaerobaculia bacterium]|nr:class I SAM-dependent methyltransferase [Thermoanaerobaculia bacterium]
MPAPLISPARTAYDAIAADYESAVASSGWVRERLWERLDALYPAGSRVLDVTAGTGLDVLHLVSRGVAVTACDLSPGMLARLAAKAPSVPTLVFDFNRLDETGLEGPFDGLISTFAGLNAAAGLKGFAASAGRLVRPGGVLFLHVLNRWRKGRTLAVRIAGVEVPHRLWTPRELARVFAWDFMVSGLSGQGIFRSVDDSPQNAGQNQRMRWERAASGVPGLRSLGTFFALELTRRG